MPWNPASPLTADACYRAVLARDARFDGQFFTAVSSTRIYCRPVCRVRSPKRENCEFFQLAAQAERAGYRPCLRCRPELAPGTARSWSLQDTSRSLAHEALSLLDQTLHEAVSMHGLAERLGVSERHLRRLMDRHLGISPLQYRQTRRLLLGKQLLCDTSLPINLIAQLSGFGSQRRFNAVFVSNYRLSPTQCRLQGQSASGRAQAREPSLGLTLPLSYRAPYASEALLLFFKQRSVTGLEQWVEAQPDRPALWRRILRVEHAGAVYRGWVGAHFDAARPVLHLQLSDSLIPVLPWLLQRARAVFDLDADPQSIEAVLGDDFAATRGWRVPGAWDGFELAVRGVLGQQVTVAAARTLTRRLVHALGDAVATPWPELSHAFPTPAQVHGASDDALGGLGIVRQRQRALRALAQATLDKPTWLDPATATPATLQALTALPGIGEWTAQYIAMRALRWPDAFPAGDLVLQQKLALRTAPHPARAAIARAAAWSPWRSYAVIRLWHGETP